MRASLQRVKPLLAASDLLETLGSCHKRQYETAKREKSQTPKVLNAILTLTNLT